ncbi:MAG TPA: DNA internalization-related competence protein ComEC/Rec2 [Thermoanaerobaculia bacterium]|nr:DNA internalization-related competence protein ComEC/Rec2 [Thermoanaerobaculia bacterium]
MDLKTLPALIPAAWLLAGAWAGLRLEEVPVPLAVALAGSGIALRGRTGAGIVALAVGLLVAQVRVPERLPAGLDPARPVEAVGQVAGHWRVEGGEQVAGLVLRRLVQGRQVAVVREEILLLLPAGEAPAPGSRVRLRGELGRSNGFANTVPVPPGRWRLRVKSLRLVETEAPPGLLAQGASSLRRRVVTAWAEALAASAGGGDATGERRGRGGASGEPGHGAAIARALVLGDASDVPPRWRRGLRRTGLAHLLAVSGLHVGMVAGLAFLLALPLPRPVQLLAALAALVLYLLIAGPRPSLLRASIMGALAVLALLAGRLPSAGNALAVAAAALVLHRPELVDDVGFRLTVSATTGVLLLGPVFERAWAAEGTGGVRRHLVRGLAATLGAQLASLPFALPVFHLHSLVSPLANLLAVPWTALALAGSLAWTAAALANGAAAAALVPWLDALAVPFGWPAAGPPEAWGTVAAVAPPWACWPFAAALALWLARPRRAASWLLGLLPALVLVPAVRWGAEGPRAHRGLEVVALDVGQGDAILLRDGHQAVLVDGGGWPRGDLGGRVLVPALAGEGVTRLAAMVLTHPDRDHCGGLVELASYLPVEALWTAPRPSASAASAAEGCAEELERAVGPGRRRELTSGDGLRLGRWWITVLHPAGGDAPGGGDNDRSLVLRAEAAGRRVLLTGDIEAGGERQLARRWSGALAADVLKVAHHGSRTSSTAPWLAAVRPRLALVSAGARNPYGHPAAPVLARLRRGGAVVLRTDRQGMLHLAWAPPPEPLAPDAAAGRPPLRLRLGRESPVPPRSP